MPSLILKVYENILCLLGYKESQCHKYHQRRRYQMPYHLDIAYPAANTDMIEKCICQ